MCPYSQQSLGDISEFSSCVSVSDNPYQSICCAAGMIYKNFHANPECIGNIGSVEDFADIIGQGNDIPLLC